MSAQAYRTLFLGEIEQCSAMTVGGNEPHGLVDNPFCRDGEGRLTLRGTGLAGALAATARKLYSKLPDSVNSAASEAVQRDRKAPRPSLWRVFNSHPAVAPATEFRQGVGILQASGAAAEEVLYDAEVLPRGTRWPFVLEVVVNAPGRDGAEAEGIAAAALAEWAQGRGWLGGAVARGMGWIRLNKLRAYRLDAEQLHLWPRADLSWNERLQGVEQAVPAIPAEAFARAFAVPPIDREWWYLQLEGRLRAGEAEDGYGIDGLSVGGHGSLLEWEQWDPERMLAPEGQDPGARQRGFAFDQPLMAGRNPEGGWEPIIPGAGLRGPLRHALSARLRRANQSVLDPNTPEGQRLNSQSPQGRRQPEDPVQALFGSVVRSAALLLRDAYPAHNDWQAALLQHHAEDEFTAGVFESSKFDRLMLLNAVFHWGLVVEGEDPAEIRRAWELLAPVLEQARLGHLPVGGGVWRGAGWVRWEWDEPVWVRAGEAFIEQRAGDDA